MYESLSEELRELLSRVRRFPALKVPPDHKLPRRKGRPPKEGDDRQRHFYLCRVCWVGYTSLDARDRCPHPEPVK